MLKSEAIELLGGSISAAAAAIGVTYQAVDKWPEVLNPRVADRVQAALWRKANPASAASVEPRPAQQSQAGA